MLVEGGGAKQEVSYMGMHYHQGPPSSAGRSREGVRGGGEVQQW